MNNKLIANQFLDGFTKVEIIFSGLKNILWSRPMSEGINMRVR